MHPSLSFPCFTDLSLIPFFSSINPSVHLAAGWLQIAASSEWYTTFFLSFSTPSPIRYSKPRSYCGSISPNYSNALAYSLFWACSTPSWHNAAGSFASILFIFNLSTSFFVSGKASRQKGHYSTIDAFPSRIWLAWEQPLQINLKQHGYKLDIHLYHAATENRWDSHEIHSRSHPHHRSSLGRCQEKKSHRLHRRAYWCISISRNDRTMASRQVVDGADIARKLVAETMAREAAPQMPTWPQQHNQLCS